MTKPNGRSITPGFILFYVLFSPDTWRLLAGIAAAVLITPHIQPPSLDLPGRLVLHAMVAGIGWAVSGVPARWITSALKQAIIKKS